MKDAAIAVMCLSVCGCAGIIAHSGEDLGQVNTSKDVMRVFGPPYSMEVGGKGGTWEYHTRRKISESNGLADPLYVSAVLGSVGLGELYWCPRELLRLAKTKLVGRKIQFRFCDGELSSIYIDGELHRAVK